MRIGSRLRHKSKSRPASGKSTFSQLFKRLTEDGIAADLKRGDEANHGDTKKQQEGASGKKETDGDQADSSPQKQKGKEALFRVNFSQQVECGGERRKYKETPWRIGGKLGGKSKQNDMQKSARVFLR